MKDLEERMARLGTRDECRREVEEACLTVGAAGGEDAEGDV